MIRLIRTYSELSKIPKFEDRFNYLKLDGLIGTQTFGYDRYINQRFYRSAEWKRVRDIVIIRDNGCDLGIEDRPIFEKRGIFIHHMNPIMLDDIEHGTDFLLNPEYLICVSQQTHNAIHYGSEDLLVKAPIERRPNDTCPWRN